MECKRIIFPCIMNILSGLSAALKAISVFLIICTLYLICKREKESTREKKNQELKAIFYGVQKIFSFFPVLYEYFKL